MSLASADHPAAAEGPAFEAPDLSVADWRRRISALYAELRDMSAVAGWWHWHEARSALFRGHPASPLLPEARGSFAGIPVFPYNPDLRFCVGLKRTEGAAVSVDLGADGVLTRRPVACTVGLAPDLGAELTLWWIEGYGGGLFLPFTDGTSGQETYGGGRYLLDAIKGADLGTDPSGRLILDFNFAYHPSCAHDPRWVCPLAPAENRLPKPVRAGERL